eukprot:4518588-Pleurochrysis_carterae.AAC.1
MERHRRGLTRACPMRWTRAIACMSTCETRVRAGARTQDKGVALRSVHRPWAASRRGSTEARRVCARQRNP